MILWLSIALVAAACLGIGTIAIRQRRHLDLSGKVTILLAFLGLVLGCGIGAQQYIDAKRGAEISARESELALGLTDTLAQIYKELIRTDLTPEAKRARIGPLIERYNRIRSSIAEASGRQPPAPLTLEVSAGSNAAISSASRPTPTGDAAPAPSATTRQRPPARPEENEDDPIVVPTQDPPPTAPVTVPPPPPPPL